MTRSNVSQLSAYVPALILKRLEAGSGIITEPLAEHFQSITLFADITGFTALSDRLALQGPAGVEELTRVLNECFGRLVDIVHDNGGDVVKFAGDALLALWPVEDLEAVDLRMTRLCQSLGRQLADQEQSRRLVVDATLAAVNCAHEIQVMMRDLDVGGGVVLSLRIAVGVGEMMSLHLGGQRGRFEFTYTGEPLLQVARASKSCDPGEIVLSPEAWSLVSDRCTGQARALGNMCLEVAPPPGERHPLRLPVLEDDAESALNAFVPGAVRFKVSAGQHGFLGELRRVTVLFINLPDINTNVVLEKAQEAVVAIQEVLYRFEGSVNKLSVDDKGVSLLAAFGLPPLSHEDDTIRGLRASLEIQSRLAALDWTCSIGVTTGKVFCGSVGSQVRCEYTMLGDVVNLAARLMQAADGGVLCDVLTSRGARGKLGFEELSPIVVKGKSQPIPIFTPIEDVDAHELVSREDSTSHRPIVGRKAELELIERDLERLTSRVGGIIILESDAGLGKSRLVAEAGRQATKLGITVLSCEADALESETPFFAWRRVLPELKDPTGSEQEAVKSLRARAADGPLMIVLENGQWLDESSWSLVSSLCDDLGSILILIAIRSGDHSAVFDTLRERPESTRIELGPLAHADSVKVIRNTLGVVSLPREAEYLVCDKAQGNPFFCEELARALARSGAISIEDGRCRLAPDGPAIETVKFPASVQAAITGRIDELTPGQQLILKVGSVIALNFPVAWLRDVFEQVSDTRSFDDDLRVLEELDLIEIRMDGEEPEFHFEQRITQEVAYNLMLFAQRRELHGAVAAAYAKLQPDDHALLARHWSEAGEVDAAIDCYERAGETAMANAAATQAQHFFDCAVQLDSQRERPSAPDRRARWYRSLGGACFACGHWTDARKHLEQALALIGQPLGVKKRSRRGLSVEQHEMLAYCHTRLFEIHWELNLRGSTLEIAEAGLEHAEAATPGRDLPRACANMSVALVLKGKSKHSEELATRALGLARKGDESEYADPGAADDRKLSVD